MVRNRYSYLACSSSDCAFIRFCLASLYSTAFAFPFSYFSLISLNDASLAVAATVAWLMTAMGTLSSGAIIGWWFGWSVYEVLIRLSGKRYVKDGLWWRDHYRVAGVMDMVSYVGFKNLMIGAVLFLAFKSMGWLVL